MKKKINKRFPGEVGNGKYRVGILFSDYKTKKKTPNLEKQNQDYIKKYELGQII